MGFAASIAAEGQTSAHFPQPVQMVESTIGKVGIGSLFLLQLAMVRIKRKTEKKDCEGREMRATSTFARSSEEVTLWSFCFICFPNRKAQSKSDLSGLPAAMGCAAEE
jgi:hypothetical protein